MSTEKDPPSNGAEPETRHWSCYTTSPARSLEIFETARKRCPVAHSDEHNGFFMLLDYEDVKGAMADYKTFSSEPQVLRPMLPRNPIPALEMDPPRHSTWRAIFNGAVTSVPAETICRLVGIDDALVPKVRETALAMFAAQGDPEEFGRRQAAFAAVTVAEVHDRQAHPRDDYLTRLAAMEIEGRRLDDNDYVVLLAAFLGAGHHSTTSAMVSLIYEVFSKPAVRDELLRNPDRIPNAIEEALRLRPPFYGFFRRTSKPTDVAGVNIPAGSDVYMGWAAANRDPKMFEAPTEYRIDRTRNRHLSFGFGIHTCPGAALARMELRVLLEELLKRLPDLRVAVHSPVYHFGGGDYAAIATLPVTFTPGKRDRASP